MKNNSILIAFSLFLFFSSSMRAQDPTFSQWDNMEVYFNPSLTGNFEGQMRFSGIYRDQWRSLLGTGAYQTGVASIEYKFSKGAKRHISLGFHSIYDESGQLLSNQSYNLTGSVSQNLGNVKQSHHRIALGFHTGLANKKVDLDQLIFQEPEEIKAQITYLDFATGFNWQYISTSRFRVQLGFGIHHLNRPNISLIENGNESLYMRQTIHAKAEIPLSQRISIVPSVLFLNQGPSRQLLFGSGAKYYFGPQSPNFIQLAYYAKTSGNNDAYAIGVSVWSASIEIKSIRFGFSMDRFRLVDSNAFEFSLGYILGRKTSTEETLSANFGGGKYW